MPVTEPNPDAVQIITIHAAKGLEWDVVAVAGLVDGGLPATATQGKDGPKDSAWLVGLGNLPYPLRGDRAHLPAFAFDGAADPKDLEERRRRFVLDAGDHQVAEERRLAYVALTRARTDLLLTAAWWGDGARLAPRLDVPDRARGGRTGRDSRPGLGAPQESARILVPRCRRHGDVAGGPVRRRRTAARGGGRRFEQGAARWVRGGPRSRSTGGGGRGRR